MVATVSFNPNNRIFDPIRRRWVKATPEEQVRQDLIQRLLMQGVPAHHILVEVALNRLPMGTVPSCRAQRRVDLLVAHFFRGKFLPLLLAECKAHPPKDAALGQLLAYQSALRSRWLVIASPGQLWVVDTEQTPDTPSASLWTHELPNLSAGTSALV